MVAPGSLREPRGRGGGIRRRGPLGMARAFARSRRPSVAVAQALTNLETLDLFGARITDRGVWQLTSLARLRHLEVCSGTITNRGVEYLSKMRNLRSLSVAQNPRVSDLCLPSIAGMPLLEALNLSQSSVTGAGILKLAPMSRLESLALYGVSRVRPHAAAKLRDAMPRLTVLGVE